MKQLLALSSLVLSMVISFVDGRPTVKPARVLDYLRKYGYLANGHQRFGAIRSQDEFLEAVKKFQRFTGLNETGDPLDPSTMEMIAKRRCGFPDLGKAATFRRKKRYAVHETRWLKKNLRYKIGRYTSDLDKQQVDDTIKSVLDMWGKYSSLTFTKVTNGAADIELRFEQDAFHGDGYPFDGPGGELAHAFYPGDNTPGIFGDVHFDDAETFTVNNQEEGVDLSWVALHELGHSLGLEHSSNLDAIMYPIYQGYHPGLQLHRDDILGIQHIYGKPIITKATVAPHTNPTQSSGTPNQCNTAIDTIIITADKTTYAFKGAYFWPISDQGAFTGALKISQFWNGLVNDIDAGYTRRMDGLTFLFKGSTYWAFFANRTLAQGPSSMSDLNLPAEVHNMDAAVEWGANGELYIFKGDKFWRYNSQRRSIDPGYPKTISSVLPGLPNDLDAALQWKNGKTYFFKGSHYYKLDDAKIRIASGYPKSISTYWMGCSPAGLINGGKISPKHSSASITLSSVFLWLASAGFIALALL